VEDRSLPVPLSSAALKRPKHCCLKGGTGRSQETAVNEPPQSQRRGVLVLAKLAAFLSRSPLPTPGASLSAHPAALLQVQTTPKHARAIEGVIAIDTAGDVQTDQTAPSQNLSSLLVILDAQALLGLKYLISWLLQAD